MFNKICWNYLCQLQYATGRHLWHWVQLRVLKITHLIILIYYVFLITFRLFWYAVRAIIAFLGWSLEENNWVQRIAALKEHPICRDNLKLLSEPNQNITHLLKTTRGALVHFMWQMNTVWTPPTFPEPLFSLVFRNSPASLALSETSTSHKLLCHYVM